ncbi:unnamed protein product [Aphanomyces euteiches]|uniref:Oxidoreductase n=1 Tax=Aphanomyces euteiches TaxID=100861 RepID=A0A6G0X9B4_9STRA|nr:hypothetical protein Ae201684_007115 [Aphanomyces euteiches]KAH9052390.1 hypothetical protein Ae201684P_001571 [Aphanomyces euteiches]KAH9151498.1 hypothetical protein AeRB84_005895 [Aphanomyces euteiches]
MSSSLLRAGLVGFGTAATFFHLPLLQASKRFTITHVLERTQSRSAALLPDATIVRSMEALLATDIDVVVIATPTDMHYAQAKMSLEAKKHVVVDKPFCVTHAEALELVALAKAQGVFLTVFHNRRWDSDFLTVQDLLRSNALGQVQYVEIHFDRFRPEPKHNWKENPATPGGGMMYDLGSHLVDQMLQLFGQPLDIKADVQSQRGADLNDDYFRLECSFPNDLTVILTAGMLVKDLGPKYIIRGTGGSFEKYGLDVQEASMREGKSPLDADFGVEGQDIWGTLTKGDGTIEKIPSRTGQYVNFYIGVADSIHGAPLPVSPEDAARVIEIVENAKKVHRKPEN